MDRERALRKVLACLRRAKSSNPNEAAIALRQAKAMMAQYGLTDDDAVAAEISEAVAGTRCRGAEVPRSMLLLADVVAEGYRCRIVVSRERYYDESCRLSGKTVIKFFGYGADAQVAAYAFTVLNRQLTADKAKHTSRIRKRANKERRGEEFAFGWIHAIRALFPAEQLEAEHIVAISAAIRTRVGETSTTTGREVGKHGRANPNDIEAGYAAGKGARLHNGIEGAAQRQLERA